jgi:hypothetical protein
MSTNRHLWDQFRTQVTGSHVIYFRQCRVCGRKEVMTKPVHPRYREPDDGRWLSLEKEEAHHG